MGYLKVERRPYCLEQKEHIEVSASDRKIIIRWCSNRTKHINFPLKRAVVNGWLRCKNISQIRSLISLKNISKHMTGISIQWSKWKSESTVHLHINHECNRIIQILKSPEIANTAAFLCIHSHAERTSVCPCFSMLSLKSSSCRHSLFVEYWSSKLLLRLCYLGLILDCFIEKNKWDQD